MSISFNYIFGNLTGLEEYTGLSGDTISGITLAVLTLLFLLDVSLCCCCCCVFCCMCYRAKRKQRKTYNLNQVERTSRSFPKSARLSRVSTSTAGGTDMEWVQDKSVTTTAKTASTEEKSLGLQRTRDSGILYEEPQSNPYQNLIDEKETDRHTRSSGYVVMSRLDKSKYDDSNNYDDITNTDQKLYDDVMNALPSFDPDTSPYDDISNVRGLGITDYEDVLNVRIDKPV